MASDVLAVYSRRANGRAASLSITKVGLWTLDFGIITGERLYYLLRLRSIAAQGRSPGNRFAPLGDKIRGLSQLFSDWLLAAIPASVEDN